MLSKDQRWIEIKTQARRQLRWYPVALGFALLFFLIDLPCSSPAQYLSNAEEKFLFLSCFFLSGWISVNGLDVIYFKLFARLKPSTEIRAITLFLGMSASIFYCLYFDSNAGHVHWSYSEIVRQVFHTVLISAFVSAFYAYKQKQNDLMSLQAASIESRYSTLKSQMQPHFLFNALNSLTELIEEDSRTAAQTAQRIADLYRCILENSKQKTSSLESELSIARRYLEIEKLRFGDRLDFRIESPSNAETIFVPSLMLQTLLENAIKHGVSRSIEGGKIELRVFQAKDGSIRTEVNNTGAFFRNPMPGASHSNGSQTGLANTISRLELLYGGSHRFQIGSDVSGRTVVSFHVSGAQIV